MQISEGPLKGYQVVGHVAFGEKVQVVKPDGSGYAIKINAAGGVTCSCQASKYRGKCKHADYISTLVPKPVRHPRAEVEGLIEEVLTALVPATEQVLVAGSYRRQKPDLKDVDLLLIGDPKKALEIAEKIGTDVVMSGEFIVRFHYKNILFDLTFTKKECWGAAVLYRTGSQQFNINCRGKAKVKGWLLNEYGLWDKDKNLIESESEAGILRELGIGWVEPRDR